VQLEPQTEQDLSRSSIVQAILPQHIDSTMRAAFVQCPRKFFHEFILGFRPGYVNADLHAGAAFSGTLEAFYEQVWGNQQTSDVALARAHGTFLKLWADYVPVKDTPKTRENMWSAVESYVKTYSPLTDPVQPFFVAGRPTYEFSFAIPLDDPEFPRHPVSGDPFIYVGRADLLGEWVNRIVIRDEKTSGKLVSNWSEQWDMRGQFLGYCWAAQRGGLKCETVVVRGVIITKTQIRHVEAVKLYQQWEIDRWYKQLAQDLHRLVRCWDTDWFDYDLAEACSMYGGCSFLPMCKSPEPSRWHSQYRIQRWNPLNRNQASEEQSQLFRAARTVSIGSDGMTVLSSEPAMNPAP
jgi:hypothetical protein